MITKIEIENLTVFDKLAVNTDASVNVFIGENGTGKTQLLKFLYVMCNKSHPSKVFLRSRISDLVRKRNLARSHLKVVHGEKEEALHILNIDNNNMENLIGEHEEFTFSDDSWYASYSSETGKEKESVFIPAKEMLTHTKGFLSMEKKFKIPFDKTLVDIIVKASGWELKEIPQFAKHIVQQLEKVMDGIVIVENDEFFILKNDGQKISFGMEAEGMKKIGLLWLLLITGNINKDVILLWDEPEANINPRLIPTIARIILELGKSGAQIFIATHDYFLPKYIEVLSSKEDKVAYHALYKTDNGVQCETDSKFSFLDNNAIIDERINLYEAEIEKGLD